MIVIYTMPDGSCRVLRPAPEMFDATSRTRRLLAERGIVFSTDTDMINWIIQKDVPVEATDVTIADDADIPADREFRNAWIKLGKRVVVDNSKRQQLQQARQMESARRTLLDQLVANIEADPTILDRIK